MLTSGVVTRLIGACKDENASSATVAAISLAALHVRCAGSAITNRPDLATEPRIVSQSMGTSVRGSTT